jgi:hypothetical protein
MERADLQRTHMLAGGNVEKTAKKRQRLGQEK